MDTNEEKKKSSTLTPAQRARKRAADRKFRKNSREKTKSYIAHLEKLVEASSASSNSSERMQDLMQQARGNYNDAHQLRSALANIIELAQSNLQRFSEHADKSHLAATHFPTSPGEVDDQEDFRSPTDNSDKEFMRTEDSHVNVHQFAENSGSTGLAELPGVSGPFQREDNEFPPSFFKPPNPDRMEAVNAITNTSDPSLLLSNMIIPEESYSYKSAPMKTVELPALNISPTTNDSSSIWSSLATITYASLSSSKRSVPLLSGEQQRAHDENILITVIVHGWHSVPEQDLFDPTWQAIRRIDEQMLRTCRAVERLAILYVLRLQFWRLLKGEYIYGAPTFMRPRPCQRIIDHLPHAEYYVWPGFREHLFVWPEKYSGDECLAFMRSCFRFIWSSDPQNLYTWNVFTGLYTLSAEFTERMNNLRCWTVERRFFQIYPELQGEIPVYDAEVISLADLGLWPTEACHTCQQEPCEECHEGDPFFATRHDTMLVS